MEWLLNQGANSQSATYNKSLDIAFNYTPLHWAAKHGHLESAEILLRNGAKQDAVNINGETPLELAVRFGCDPVARLLIDPQFKGAQDTLFTHTPTKNACLEKFEQMFQSQEKLSALLCLEKLADLYLHESDITSASLVLNSAAAIAEKSQLFSYQKLIYKKLERIEGKFIVEKFGAKLSADHRDYLSKDREAFNALRESLQGDLSKQIPPKTLQKSLSDSFLKLFGELASHCCKMIDKQAPTRFAVVTFGNLASREMLPYSKVGFGIFIESSSPESTAYFKNLYQLIKLRVLNLGETDYPLASLDEASSFIKAGFCFDTNFEMVATPDDLASLQTRTAFEKDPSKELIWLENHCVFGESALHEKYQKALQTALNSKRNLLAPRWREESALKGFKQLVQHLPGFMHLRPINTTQVFLSRDLYTPLHRAIHLLGLFFDSKETNAFSILEQLEKQGVMNEEGVKKLQLILIRLVLWSIQTQIRLQSGADACLFDLVKDSTIPKKDLLEVFQGLVPFYKACEDFAKDRSKAFAKLTFFNSEIAIE